MCSTCGCGENELTIHAHDHAHDHAHEHPHVHDHAPEGRRLTLEQDILAKNAEFAAGNRRLFTERGILVLNLVSSPGSGKTTLLARTVQTLRAE
ncbi:MAG: hydrogenase nickel incorporation protein HypB, partial [Candidatus Competibacter phosphatis]